MIPEQKFKRAVLFLLFMVLFFGGLYFAASFLKPLAVALLLAFLMLPVARKLESWKAPRWLSTLTCTLIVVLLLGSVVGLVAYQGKQFSEDYTQLKQKADEKVDQVTAFITSNTGITEEQFKTSVKESSLSQVKNSAQGFLIGLLNSTTDILLMLVYIYTFLFYRTHFKKFVIRLFPDTKRKNVTGVLEESVVTALSYLKGKMMLVALLAVIYSVGLSLIGVKFAVFYGVLAAILSLIPYIGNLIGGALPVLTALLYGNALSALLVVALFTLTQFVESYVLQPLVVGKEVDLNPMMSILIVILAGILWGIPGMIIAIPYLGIVMVLFSHIPGMEPYAFLLREEKNDSS